MRKSEKLKKLLSILMCVCMLVQYVPTVALAAETDGLCAHHTVHTAECGYISAAAEVVCTHEHTEGCSEQVTNCLHAAHDESCGGLDAAACTHVCSADSGCVTTILNCGHSSDGSCCYVASVAETPCSYAVDGCSECDVEEEKTTEPSMETSEPTTETTEPAPVCNCGTDDPAIHATTCAVYVAPENPVCYCAEKCTEPNVWCDVCGFDHTRCTGTCEAMVYAFSLTVKQESGSTITVEVEPNDSIDAIKAAIQEQLGIAPDQQLLYCGDTLLEDGNTLTDYGIESGAEINLVIRYRVSIAKTAGGTVTSDVGAASMGTKITLTITPNEGFLLDTLTASYENEGGQIVELEIVDNAFTMPSFNVTVSATFRSCTHDVYTNGCCAVCGVSLVASLTKFDNTVVYYADVDDAFRQAETDQSGTVTVLKDAGTSEQWFLYQYSEIHLEVPTGVTLTVNHHLYLDGNISGGGTIANNSIIVTYSNSTFRDCTVSGGKVQISGVVTSGTFNCPVDIFPCTVNGGTFNNTVNNGGTINGGTFNGALVNYYQGILGTINNETKEGAFTLGENFSIINSYEEHTEWGDVEKKTGIINCTYHIWADGTCRLCAVACDHADTEKTYADDQNGTTHTPTCICGKALDPENHTFDKTGKCVCGKQAVAKLDNEYYDSFESAVAAITAEDSTITVFTDVTIGEGETLNFPYFVPLSVAEGKAITCNGTVTIGTGDAAKAGVIFQNALYYDGGDITSIGVQLDKNAKPTYYKAGDGYALYDASGSECVLELHDATIQTKNPTEDDGIFYQNGSLTIRFFGQNTVTAGFGHGINAASCILTLEGGEGATLTVTGGSSLDGPESCGINGDRNFIITSGTVTAIGGSGTTGSYGIKAESITVASGAVLNAVGGAVEAEGNASGILAATVSGEGTINALRLCYSSDEENDSYAISWTAMGNAVVAANMAVPSSEEEGIPINISFTVPTGTTLTVNSGVTLDLSTMAVKDIDFSGTVVNNGTIILPADFSWDNAPKSGTVTIYGVTRTWDATNSKWICAEDSHTPGYTASGKTITETCEVCETVTGTATIVAEDVTYTGEAYAGADMEYNWMGEEPTIRYNTDNGSAPVKAGTYTVTMTVGDKSVSDSFTISPKDIANCSVTLDKNSFVYSGTAPALTVNAVDNGVGSTALTEDDYTVGAVQVDAGSYKLTITGIGNYEGSVELDYAITAKEVTITGAEVKPVTYDPDGYTLTVTGVTFNGVVEGETLTYTATAELKGTNAVGTQGTEVTVTLNNSNYVLKQATVLGTVTINKAASSVTAAPTAQELTYNGNAQELVSAGSTTDGTMMYSLDGEDWNGQIPTGIAAGEYTVWYYVQGGGNHNDSEKQSVKVAIKRKVVTVTADAVSKEYGEDDPVLRYQADGLASSDTLEGGLSRDAGEKAGTYAISQGTLTNENNPNYDIAFVPGVFTIHPTDNYNEKVSKKQDVIREVGAFEEPSYSGIHGEKVAGNLSYIYRGASYTYEELVEVLKAMPFGALLQVDYTFSPTDSNYTGNRTGAMEIIVYTVRFKVNGETATAENAIVRTGTPVYGDTLSDRITISGALTAELLRETDANPHNFSFSHKPGDPLPVGTHTIQILYSGTILGVEYKNVTVCEFTVTVNKADSAVTKAPEAISGLKFKEENGNEVQQALVTAGEATGGTMVYRIGSDGEWSQDIPTAGQVRDYTVYYKVLGDSNHNDSAEGQVNVSIVKADAPTVTIPVQEHFYTIPTAENRIDIKSLLPKLCGIINEESEVTGTTGDFIENAAFNNGVLSYDTKTGTLGATGTITVKIVMRNYEDVTVTVNVELIDLNPVSNSGTDDEIKYDGSTYDVAQMFSKDTNAGEASYEISGGSGAGELNGSVLTITKAGTIQIKLTTAAQGDYAAGEATATLTVKKADGAGSVTMDDWTYGETAKTPTTENGTGTAIFLYTGSGYSSANVPTDAGTYTVTATFVENDLYKAATASDTFVIAQKELIPSISDNVSKTYDGTTTVPDGLSIMLDGIVIGDNISATASYAYDGADAGTTKINATNITLGGADAGNYTLKSTTASADVGEITKADPIYEAPAAATLTYNGSEQTLLTGGSVMGGKFQYSLDNQNWSDTIPIGKNAENYTVYFKVVGDSNHNDNAGDSVPVTITKQDVTITAKDQTIVYGQTISQTEIISSGLVDGHSVTVTLTPSTTILTENGTITASNAVISVNGTDVTANYEISYEDGKLVITFDTSGIDALDPETVTSDDRETLEEALDTIEALLEEDLTEEQKKTLEDVKTDVEALIERIEAAQDALDTENTEKVEDVTTDNVKPEDKDALEKAKTDLEKALEDNSSNYTEEEKQAIQDEIQRIEDAIEALENVEDVTDAITQLPETVEPDDEEAAEKIMDAKEAYDELTDHEKSLVEEDLKEKLEDLVAALADYKIIKGNGGKWTKGSSYGLSFTANGPFSKFVGIEVDGKEVDAKYYDAKSGSTIITLKQSFLKRLSTGEHTITVLYADGETSGTFKILAASSTPATGDDFNIVLWSAVLCISVLGLIVLFIGSKKRRTTK